MAKRPLGGAGESRLGKIGTAETDVTTRPKIIKPTVVRRRNHSIRLSGTEEARLQRLIQRISGEAERPVRSPTSCAVFWCWVKKQTHRSCSMPYEELHSMLNSVWQV